MIPHHCRVKHDPPDTYGDCLRASIASLLNVEKTEDVPHFLHDGCDGPTSVKRLNEYLATKHLRSYWIAFPGEWSRDEVLRAAHQNNPDTYYLLFGQTPSGGDHVVIALNDEIIHDTAWYPGGVVRPRSDNIWVIMLFIPLIMVAHS